MRRNRVSYGRRRLAVAALLLVVGAGMVGAAPAHASEYHLDIDIGEQVLSEVIDGYVVAEYHISSGSGEAYWSEGAWWDGETPRGWFHVYFKERGWAEGALGALYNAMYFYEGYAIHGSGSVPYYPASHGCVRVSIGDADWLYDRVAVGTPVHVHD